MLEIINPFCTPVQNIPTVDSLRPGELFEIDGKVLMIVEVKPSYLLPEETYARLGTQHGELYTGGYQWCVELNTGSFGVFHGKTPCHPLKGQLTVATRESAHN